MLPSAPPAVVATVPFIINAPCTLSGDIRAFAISGHTVLVRLPSGYDAPANAKRRYPVLYLLDGQNVFDDATSFAGEWHADETATRLEAAGKIELVIIVAIYNAGANRVTEYTSVTDANLQAGGGANEYAKWMATTLKPVIDARFRSKPGAANTAIGGSSLGGLFALFASFVHGRTWGKAAVLSPSVWWADRAILGTVAATAPAKPRLYISTGTAEDKSGNALAGAQALRDALITRGYRPKTDFSYTETIGAAHNEAAWSARFGDVLTYLFPR